MAALRCGIAAIVRNVLYCGGRRRGSGDAGERVLPVGPVTEVSVFTTWLAAGAALAAAAGMAPGRLATRPLRDDCAGLADRPGAAGRSGRLQVVPSRVAPGFPVAVGVSGLAPGATATIHALSAVSDDSGGSDPYYAAATFHAGPGGAFRLDNTAPIAGSYHGADPQGLFWSARPVAGDAAAGAAVAHVYRGRSAREPGAVVLALETSGVVVDCAVVTFVRRDSALVRQDVRSHGIVGVLYAERGARHRPVVVVLGGSEGGLDLAAWIGPKLAARGYAVFGLEYVSPRGDSVAGVAPSLSRIPVELLDSARAWLAGRPEVAIDRFGLLGYSKGGEFALVLASIDPWIRAVVAYAPSDVVWQGIEYGESIEPHSSWSRGGRELPFVPTTGTRDAILQGRRAGTPIVLGRIARANLAAASAAELQAAAIPLQASHAALLLFGGGDDELWDSGASVARLMARLRGSRYAESFRGMVYPGAGHVLVGTGWQSTTADNADQIRNGGTAAADAHAQRDAWQRMLAFFGKQLGH